MNDVTSLDETLLRRAIAISVRAVEHGNHPFGSLLADGETVLLESENTVNSDNDVTGHAETNLVRMTSRYTLEQLRTFTLYTSCEPCAMCAGAIYWSGIGRVVYALSEQELLPLTGDHPDNPTLDLPCREIFARGQRTVTVAGPALANEARAPHLGFWI